MPRTLHLTSPLTTGADVTRLQHAINTQAHRDDSARITPDGQYGPTTAGAEAHAAFLLGAANPHDHARAQRILLHPTLRTPLELARCARLKREIAKRRVSGPGGAVALALKLARKTPHITENPAGSNTDHGAIIDIAQREVGIHAAFWCGAAAHYILKHGGGLDVSADIRYCPSTEAHAKAGTGGFREWIPVARAHDAPIGALVLYDEHGIAGHVGILVERIAPGSDTLHTVEGNTSSGPGGSQSNGGGIFERRDRTLHAAGFAVRGFAIPRWPQASR